MAELMVEALGWVGTFLVLLAYFLLTRRTLDRNSRVYHIMNLVGAIFIGVNSMINGAYPSTTVNVVWSVIAIYGIVESFR